ncbi:ribonuclease P subunit p25 [Olea europaea subsp. europaea]|uniref:Ribonuclease P subunit p25 n=1 Tax=Olea europaea subsp. europaea TaxID=158383 RepID=A0A8S0SF70_OLEEU|nr:ribonuclease P subunit p25 [Olea europaea subsp. europaea]
MDRYQKVEKPKVETPIDENEIRITSQGRMRSYITYAMSLLQEMVFHLLSMRMEVMGGIVSTPGVGNEAEVAISVVVGGEGTMVRMWIFRLTVKAIIKNHRFEVVAVGGTRGRGRGFTSNGPIHAATVVA